MDVHISRNDQYAALTLSQFGSLEASAALSVGIRMAEMIQVLPRTQVSYSPSRDSSAGPLIWAQVGYSQKAQTKDSRQNILLPPGQLQRADHGQRHDEERHVCREIEARHDVPNKKRAETFALD